MISSLMISPENKATEPFPPGQVDQSGVPQGVEATKAASERAKGRLMVCRWFHLAS